MLAYNFNSFLNLKKFVVYSGVFLFFWVFFCILCDQNDKYILILEVVVFQRLTYLVLFQIAGLESLCRKEIQGGRFPMIVRKNLVTVE